eukprot:gene31811-39296_t
MSTRIAQLENKIQTVDTIDSRVRLLESKYHALEEQKIQSDLQHFNDLSANKSLIHKLENDNKDLLLLVKQLETGISRAAFDSSENHTKLKNRVDGVETRAADQLKLTVERIDDKIHAVDCKHINSFESVKYTQTQNSVHIDNQIMKLNNSFGSELSQLQSNQTDLSQHYESLHAQIADLQASQRELVSGNNTKHLSVKIDECVDANDRLEGQIFELQEKFISQLIQIQQQQQQKASDRRRSESPKRGRSASKSRSRGGVRSLALQRRDGSTSSQSSEESQSESDRHQSGSRSHNNKLSRSSSKSHDTHRQSTNTRRRDDDEKEESSEGEEEVKERSSSRSTRDTRTKQIDTSPTERMRSGNKANSNRLSIAELAGSSRQSPRDDTPRENTPQDLHALLTTLLRSQADASLHPPQPPLRETNNASHRERVLPSSSAKHQSL